MNRAVLTASVFLAASPALALEEVSFGTNWVPEAEHGGYYQAAADGTYEACGLKVTIVPGGPQVNNRALLMAGKLDFNMSGNLLLPFNAVEQGIPLKVVAAHFQKEPQVILTHPGKVASFEELTTLPKLFIGDNGYQSYYQWMITEFGFKPEARVPYTFNPGPFIADPDSGQQGYITSEPFAIEREGGFKPDIWVIADEGFNTYATLVEVMQDTLDTKPEVVKCFVEGSAIGWANYLYGDPTLGNALIREQNPEMSQEQIDYSIVMMRDYGIVDSGDALEYGIGAMTEATITSFYDKMVAAGVVAAGLDLSKVYSLDYANTGAAIPVKKKLLGE
ncbi:ABC transporter substrate-binding protein [Mesobacterium sp. TK19101]|uniref:ABC transporter substrate-binding protein n=1 Tax=Mesobacterium hydrothermale TaxID=3111907 RepID=A0ABU6HMY7_9RHOB|nr:ABC transporter substrate-binding protein [Mesobacterium sp. TK19101]MEC3862565.1 ABC transporter substrate-binding protein [Mesobacterium sp. TK19101]